MFAIALDLRCLPQYFSHLLVSVHNVPISFSRAVWCGSEREYVGLRRSETESLLLIYLFVAGASYRLRDHLGSVVCVRVSTLPSSYLTVKI